MKNLKHLSGIGLMALAFCLSSCEQEDNTDQLLSGLNSLEKRVEALEALQEQVDAIKALIDASANNYLITNVEEITENEAVVGYKITFSNGETITINNGKDGESGATPEISVATDTDGKLYWKVNGEWLMNGTEKVPAEGVTPQFKIEDNQWKVSYDGDTSWKNVVGGGISGGTGTTVTVDDTKDDYYIFSIGDQTIQIQKYKPLEITFDSLQPGNAVIEVSDTEKSKEISYSVSLGGIAEGVTPIIMAFADSKYTVAIDESNKKITVSTTESNLIDAEVTVLVSDGGQRTIMRSIKFVEKGSVEQPEITLPGISNGTLNITADAGRKEITVSSNLRAENIDIVINQMGDWISIDSESEIQSRADTNYKLILNVAVNESLASREATITLSASDFNVSFYIVQVGKEIPADVTVFDFTGVGADTGESALKKAMENSSISGLITSIVKLKITGNKLGKADLQYLRDLSKNNALRELDLSESNTQTISTEAFSYSKLESILLPETSARIWGAAFRNSENLTTITIPYSVKAINNTAFFGSTRLKTVIIEGKTDLLEGSVSSIQVFQNCTELESITIKYKGTDGIYDVSDLLNPGDVTTDKSNFSGIPNTCKLYVPSELLMLYKADAGGWASVFTGDRIQAIE